MASNGVFFIAQPEWQCCQMEHDVYDWQGVVVPIYYTIGDNIPSQVHLLVQTSFEPMWQGDNDCSRSRFVEQVRLQDLKRRDRYSQELREQVLRQLKPETFAQHYDLYMVDSDTESTSGGAGASAVHDSEEDLSWDLEWDKVTPQAQEERSRGEATDEDFQSQRSEAGVITSEDGVSNRQDEAASADDQGEDVAAMRRRLAELKALLAQQKAVEAQQRAAKVAANLAWFNANATSTWRQAGDDQVAEEDWEEEKPEEEEREEDHRAAVAKAQAFLLLDCGFTRQELDRAYRREAARRHPDKCGGSSEAFVALRNAYELLLEELCL